MRQNIYAKLGFTMVELLVVVSMIGILATVAIPRFIGARKKALVDQGSAQVQALEASIELYKQLRSPTRTYDFSAACMTDAKDPTCELDFDGGESQFDYSIEVPAAPGNNTYTIKATGYGKCAGTELEKTRGDVDVTMTAW